jgi:hypothetical protein
MQQNASSNGWGSVSATSNTLGDSISGWLHNPNYSGAGKNLLQVENTGSGWSAYNLSASANKQIIGAPSVVYNGQYVAFGVTPDGKLDQFTLCPGGGAWCSYDLTGQNAMQGGVRAVMNGSSYEVFGGSADGSLLQIENTGSGWSVYNLSSSNGVHIVGAPGVIWGSGGPTIYAVDTNNHLYSFSIVSGSWQAAAILPSQSFYGGVVALQHGSNVELFARGINGHMFQVEQSGGTWSTYDIYPSLLTSGSPGVIWNSSGPNVFVADSSGYLRQLSVSGGAWRLDTVLSIHAVGLNMGVDAVQVGSAFELFAASW